MAEIYRPKITAAPENILNAEQALAPVDRQLLYYATMFQKMYRQGGRQFDVPLLKGIVTRVIPSPGNALTNKNGRRIVFWSDNEASCFHLGQGLPQIMKGVGYTPEQIERCLNGQRQYNLFVTHENLIPGKLWPANWKNLIDLARLVTTESEEVAMLDYAAANFTRSDSSGIRRLADTDSYCAKTLAFFEQIAGINSQFRGDGYTQRHNNASPWHPELISLNFPLANINGLTITLPY